MFFHFSKPYFFLFLQRWIKIKLQSKYDLNQILHLQKKAKDHISQLAARHKNVTNTNDFVNGQ